MCTRSLGTLVLVLAVAGCATNRAGGGSRAVEGPNLGRPASQAEIAAWDISILPDGSGLPPGRGTSAKGTAVYAEKCQSCHGEKGAGQPNDRLVGGHGTLASKSPVRTVGSYWPYSTTVFDYVRRAMPYTNPRTLSDDDVYAVTAYLLYLNGIIGETDEMNAQTLPKVKMPNRDNFILAYPPPRK
jgi:S-disulfanyl-L-cysteine oxidoreductase SoxD